jgi:ABC-2 type transport system ATP-binding protein
MKNASMAIEAFTLTKRYPHQRGLGDFFSRTHPSETTALKEVSLEVEEGEVFGLLGPNGSGKTTLLKLLSTILSPTSGRATIFGHDIDADPRAIRGLVSLVTGEERSLYWRLTGRQNLEFFGRLYALNGVRVKHKVEELLDLFDLRHVRDVRVAEYSTGMKQRLAVARGLLSGPRLLFLDEPTRGLDPVAAHSLLNGVKERAVDYFANTVILTTHIMREVEQLCRRIAVLNRGSLVFQGTVDGLRSSLERTDRYAITAAKVTDECFRKLLGREGVESCSREDRDDGTTEIEIVFSTSRLGLSGILKHLFANGVEILRCTKKEQSLEELFRTIFDARGHDHR